MALIPHIWLRFGPGETNYGLNLPQTLLPDTDLETA